MMLETGFVTHSEYQKHIRGEWRTVHDLWRHIRNYMASYAQPGGFTQGSIAYADADGFLTENNAQLYWDAAQHFLGVGVGAPVCRTHIRIAVCADYDDVQPDVALLLENDANVRLQLQAATNSTAYIEFCSDENNPPAGRVAYDFPDDQLEFGVGGNEILRLKAGPTFDYAGTLTLDGIVAITGASINLRNKAELRFYDNGNYVGFEAPNLVGNTIWILPDADGNAGDVLRTSGAGVLSFNPAGAGDVTAAAVMTDHAIVRGDGGAKGIQDTGILIDDNDNMTLPDGASLTLQESIVFAGATTENIISFPDDLPVALVFTEAANPYLTFISTDGSEAVNIAKTLILATVINAGVDTDKFLVLDAGDRVDFRTGAELLADIGGVAAATFVGLTDTPANYAAAAKKIVRVNAAPNALEFGADIEDLEDVDTLTGQAGKYAKVKVGDAGIEWDTPAGGNGAIDYLDNFEDASIHWSWRTDDLDANRTIVEAANKLTIAVAGGTDGNWWDTVNNAPKLFTGIGRPPCEIITKLITVTTNDDTRCGIFVSSNPIAFGANYAMMLTRRTVGGTESLQVQRSGTGYTPSPGAPYTTLPIWLKIRITADIRYGNHLRFYYSVNGIDWTELADPAGGYSDLLTSDGFVVGLFAQNWNGNNAVSAEYDFFKVVPCLGADG